MTQTYQYRNTTRQTQHSELSESAGAANGTSVVVPDAASANRNSFNMSADANEWRIPAFGRSERAYSTADSRSSGRETVLWVAPWVKCLLVGVALTVLFSTVGAPFTSIGKAILALIDIIRHLIG